MANEDVVLARFATYPSGGETVRVERGDVVTDLPAADRPWLLSQGQIVAQADFDALLAAGWSIEGLGQLADDGTPGILDAPLAEARDRARAAAALARVETDGPDLTAAAADLVEEHGLDAARIPGTGAGGRITKGDVEAYLAEREASDDEELDAPPSYVIDEGEAIS